MHMPPGVHPAFFFLLFDEFAYKFHGSTPNAGFAYYGYGCDDSIVRRQAAFQLGRS